MRITPILLTAGLVLGGCSTLTTPTTDPTSLSQALDYVTGPAICGEQRAVRAQLLIEQLDAITDADGSLIAAAAPALAQVQALERQPRSRVQAGLAQAVLVEAAFPYIKRLDPMLAQTDNAMAAALAALSLGADVGFAFGEIGLVMHLTPCPVETEAAQ